MIVLCFVAFDTGIRKETSWKSVDPVKFLGSASTIVLSKDAVPQIANPVARSLVEKFHRMKMCVRDIPSLEKCPGNILLELSHAKLGTSLPTDCLLPDESLKEAEIEALAKLATLLGKDCEKAGKTLGFVRKFLPATENPAEKKEKKVKGEEPDKPDKKDQEKAPNHTFQPGDVVRLSVTKNKKKFDGFKATVISAGSKLVKINLEEGPHSGAQQQFPFENLSLISSSAKRPVPEQAVPSVESKAEEEPAAKRQRAEALFGGDLGDL